MKIIKDFMKIVKDFMKISKEFMKIIKIFMKIIKGVSSKPSGKHINPRFFVFRVRDFKFGIHAYFFSFL